MDWKVGEIKQIKGEWYQCVVAMQGCRECSFRTQGNCKCFSECFSVLRSDGRSVIFKELKKVGKPFYRRWTLEGNNKLMQRYEIYTTPLITIDKQKMFYNLTEDLLEIEIKQEDMEEKVLKCTRKEADILINKVLNVVSDYPDKDNEFIASKIEEYLDIQEESKPILKEFDLEAAKEGKPVYTRDGRKARIICFDRKLFYRKVSYPILALVERSDGEDDVCGYNEKGKVLIEDGAEYKDDLMMLPEKKEGWVNVYHNEKGEYWSEQVLFSTKKEAIDFVHEHAQYVTTVKVEWEE